MKKLSDLIPNWEDVLRLEPEQLAGILLEIHLEIDGNDRQFFHRGNFFNQFASTQNYPAARGGEVAQATLEAWMYLERGGVPRSASGRWYPLVGGPEPTGEKGCQSQGRRSLSEGFTSSVSGDPPHDCVRRLSDVSSRRLRHSCLSGLQGSRDIRPQRCTTGVRSLGLPADARCL